MESLTLTALREVPTVRAGDDLALLVGMALRSTGIDLKQGDILVLAQKIVSKAEGRFVSLGGIAPSEEAERLARKTGKDARIVELVLRQSQEVVRAVPGVLIVRHRLGMVMANAGIDASNVERGEGEDTVLLLPENPDASAERLRRDLAARFGTDVGIIINDSFGRAWRLGTVGTAIGVSGLPALVDLRGRQDRNGRVLLATVVGFADELAAAASLVMGQASEGRPVIHVRGVASDAAAGHAGDLVRPLEMDLFR